MYSVLQQKQNDYEETFQSFAVRDYIRSMLFCHFCNGSGCDLCSGHGWRHTSESIAFGQGLNSMATDMNPYASFTRFPEFIAWGKGYKNRQLSECRRIRAAYGIDQPDTSEALTHD